MNTMSMVMDVDIVSNLASFIVATRVELLLFFAAVIAYFALFGNALPKDQRREAKIKVKMEPVDREQSSDKMPPIDSEDCDQLEKSFQVAFENGDHRSVLRCWNTMKKFGKVPGVPLTQVIESMQRFKKDTPFIIRELKTYFKKYPSECDMGLLNDLLEALSKRLDSDLMEKIVEILPSLELKSDQRTYEIFLNMYFTTRNFQEVKSLVAEMTANQIPFTTRSTIVVVKTALKLNNFEEALRYFRDLKVVWTGSGVTSSSTALMASRHIVSQLVEMACKEHQLSRFLPELSDVPVTEDMINGMFTECVRQKDSALAMQVEKLANAQNIPLSDATYRLMVKTFSGDPAKLQQVFDDALSRNVEHSAEFILAIISSCNQTGNIDMVDKLHKNTKSKQLQVLLAFIRFYADNEQYEKACDVFEHELVAVHAADSSDGHRSLFLDARLERSLMTAALRCGREHLTKTLLDSSPSDLAKHKTMIKNCAAEGNLQGAMSVFEILKKSEVELNSVIYNTVLDACVECHDMRAAEKWMKEALDAGMADVVSFNTLIKAHLKNENFEKARSLMEEMKQHNLEPSLVTFNELINAMVMQGGERQRSQVWDFVAEMREAGVKPNQVTCSILMKKSSNSDANDIMKTMELINMTDEPMDEVLLSSVVEACVRIGKPELLVSKLQQLQGTGNIAVTSSHTFGSLIKAYGRANDIDGVWRWWKEMRSRQIKPTSITLGCMVEAVVSNGDTEGGHDLIHQMQDDEQCHDVLNSVIYGSVLKGFAREKKMDRVWAVYEEMNKMKIDFSVVTYNTIINACARSGRMEDVAKLLEGMTEKNIKPNLITYSTMLKGYCQAGNIQMGLQILAEMKKDAALQPDEIMYNSLLDGCAQKNLVDEGLRLFEEMQRERVVPSNFTLCILVKMMGGARKLDGAFNIVRDITAKYNFKANVHVYTNLVQACVSSKQLPRAFGVLETMVKEGIQPESRTYAIMIRVSISHRHYDQVAGLLRAALGLRGALPSFLAAARSSAMCPNLDVALVNEALAALADSGRVKDIASPLLADIKQQNPRVRIDPNIQRRIAPGGVGQSTQAESHPWSNRNSKGNGKGRDSRGHS